MKWKFGWLRHKKPTNNHKYGNTDIANGKEI